MLDEKGKATPVNSKLLVIASEARQSHTRKSIFRKSPHDERKSISALKAASTRDDNTGRHREEVSGGQQGKEAKQ